MDWMDVVYGKGGGCASSTLAKGGMFSQEGWMGDNDERRSRTWAI